MRRYPALRIIIMLHYLLAVLVVLAAFIWVKATGEFAGIVATVGVVAGAEVLKLLIDIEENTRRAAPPLVPPSAPVGEESRLEKFFRT